MFFQGGGGCVPKQKKQLMSAKEAKQLLEFFEKNKYLIIDSDSSQSLLKIIFKIHLKSDIVDVGLPKNANFKRVGLHVSLTDRGRETLKLFL